MVGKAERHICYLWGQGKTREFFILKTLVVYVTQSHNKRYLLLIFLLSLPFLFSRPSYGNQLTIAAADLTSLSLEELMNIQVYSSSKRLEPAYQTPSAVTVLQGDDLRRMGINSIPEALRLVPGMEVAQFSSHQWAVTSRGFNGRFADKLLVLVDGRSVYTPLTAGVQWSRQDTTIEDIDRIEIIRGPGGSVWGANAVNGVVNIITKSADKTEGLLAYAGGGEGEKGFGGIRYGAKVGENSYMRGFVRYRETDGLVDVDGERLNDNWDSVRGGFRFDAYPAEGRSIVFLGESYKNKPSLTNEGRSGRYDESADTNGGHLLARIFTTLDDGSDLEIQAYFDRTERIENDGSNASKIIETADIDLTHHFAAGKDNQISWGLGYRNIHFNNVTSGSTYYVDPAKRDNLFSAFIQNRITLMDNSLFLTIGTKVELNDYTGFEFQPSARILYSPDPKTALWGAVTRTVRTPTRADNDLGITTSYFELHPSPDLASEKTVSYEAGYRSWIGENVMADIAFHYNVYDELRTEENIDENGLGIYFQGNEMSGSSYGAELSVTADVTKGWRIRAGYTIFRIDLKTSETSVDTDSEGYYENSSPANKLFLTSYIDLPWNMEADLFVSYVDSLKFSEIPSYTKMDARLGWNPGPDWEFSLIGKNLTDERHPEYEASYQLAEEMVRSFWVKAVYRR